MTHDELNAWKHAQPFRPFKLIMQDGREYSVADSDDIFVPPKSECVYLTEDRVHADPVFREWIVRIEPASPAKRVPRRRRAG